MQTLSIIEKYKMYDRNPNKVVNIKKVNRAIEFAYENGYVTAEELHDKSLYFPLNDTKKAIQVLRGIGIISADGKCLVSEQDFQKIVKLNPKNWSAVVSGNSVPDENSNKNAEKNLKTNTETPKVSKNKISKKADNEQYITRIIVDEFNSTIQNAKPLLKKLSCITKCSFNKNMREYIAFLASMSLSMLNEKIFNEIINNIINKYAVYFTSNIFDTSDFLEAFDFIVHRNELYLIPLFNNDVSPQCLFCLNEVTSKFNFQKNPFLADYFILGDLLFLTDDFVYDYFNITHINAENLGLRSVIFTEVFLKELEPINNNFFRTIHRYYSSTESL